METSMLDADAWLVMFLEPKLAFATTPTEPGEEFTANGARYGSVYSGAVAAFYDRILDDAGRLAGVRFCPTAENLEALFAKLPARPYLRVASGASYFDVYFRGPPYPRGSSEGDQAFGGRVYEAAPGKVAVSLDLGYLATSPDELDAVRTAAVRWITL
jgi:hypothetical protein